MNHFAYMTTKKLAVELGVPVSCVQRWARMRVIPSIRAGWRTRLFNPDAVRVALDKLTITSR